ncbi:MAG: hypothetical protein PHO67_08415 [Candidatus Omnitrophica bacterium]|nr:hypothetical protein [Candidatus Omnitrophota bacterium]
MGSLPVGTVITMLISIGIAAGGIILGQIARANAAKARESYVALEWRVRAAEVACEDGKQFCDESRRDRAELRKEFGDIRGDLRVLLERQESMAEKLDAVHKKIFNGGV